MERLKADLLIITSEKMENSLSTHLLKQWSKVVDSDGRKKRGGEGVKKLYNRKRRYLFRGNAFYENGVQKMTGKIPEHPGIVSITSPEELELFLDNFHCTFEHLLITPELGWEKEMSAFDGYDVAEYLINKVYENRTLQIKFVSVLSQKQLLQVVPKEKSTYTESFPHLSLLDLPVPEELFGQYSEIHFELIKNLTTSLKGRLAGKEHKFLTVYNNIVSGDSESLPDLQNKLINVLQDLQSIETIIDVDISKLIKRTDSANNHSEVVNIADIVRNGFKSTTILEDGDRSSTKPKHNYSVCIVEDNPEYLKFLSKTFGSIFSSVYPTEEDLSSYDIQGLQESIEEIANDYDVFILDLLYQNDEKWFPYNGLELYEKIRNENPYAVIRIVTNLPREIISRISEKMYREEKLTEKIPLSSIFTKTRGDKYLKEYIVDNSDEISEECKLNENMIRKGEYEIPEVGVFAKKGVKKKILRLIKNKPEQYHETISKAFHYFELFKKGELHRETPGWREGELPSSSYSNWNELSLLKHLPNIFSHRLFVLSLMDRVTNLLDMRELEETVGEVVGFDSFHETHYLTTRLGLRKLSIWQDDNNQGNLSYREIKQVQIKTDELFVHERDFLNNGTRIQADEVNEELIEWLMEILTSYDGSMVMYFLDRKESGFDLPYYESADDKEIPDRDDVKAELLTMEYIQQLAKFLNRHKDRRQIEIFIKEIEPSFEGIKTLKNVPDEVVNELNELFV